MMSIAPTGPFRKPQNLPPYFSSLEARYEPPKSNAMMIRIEKKIATDMIARAIIKPIFHYYIEVFTRLKSLNEQSARHRRVNESRMRMTLKKLLLIREKFQRHLLAKGFYKIQLKAFQLDALTDCSSISETLLFKVLSLMFQRRRIKHAFMRDPLVYKLFSRVKLAQILNRRAVNDIPRSVSRNLFEAFRKLHFISSLNAFKDVGDQIAELTDRKNEYAMLAMTKILKKAVIAQLNSCKALFTENQSENPLKSPSYLLVDKFVTKLYQVIVSRFSRYVKRVPRATNGLLKGEKQLLEQILKGKAWKKLQEHSSAISRMDKQRRSACIKIAFCIQSGVKRTCASAFKEFGDYAEAAIANSNYRASLRLSYEEKETSVALLPNRYIIFAQCLNAFSKAMYLNSKAAGWNAIQEFVTTQQQNEIHKQIFSQKMQAFASAIHRSVTRQRNQHLAVALCFETLKSQRNLLLDSSVHQFGSNAVQRTTALALSKFSWILLSKIRANLAYCFYRLLKVEKSLQSTYIQKVSEKNYTAQINKNMIFNMSVVNSKLEKKIIKRSEVVRKQNAVIKFSKLLMRQASIENEMKQYGLSTWQRNISFPQSKVSQYKHFNDVLEQENRVLLDEINQIQEAQRELNEMEDQKIEGSNSKEFHIGDLMSPTSQQLNGLKLDFDKDLKDSIFNKPMFVNTEENEESNESRDFIAHYEFLERQNVELLGLIQQTQDEFEMESTQYQAELDEIIAKINSGVTRNKGTKTELDLSLKEKNFH